MYTIFMISKYDGTPQTYILLLNLTDKINLKRSYNYVISYNWITFKIKTWFYLQLLILETMKLLGGTKNKISKDENGENVLHLEITEVVLVHCNIVTTRFKSHVCIYS